MEAPYVLTFHPSGYYVAVAFQSLMRCFTVYTSELVSFWEILNHRLNLLRFSSGGQYLATADQDVVTIYSFWKKKSICHVSVSTSYFNVFISSHHLNIVMSKI